MMFGSNKVNSQSNNPFNQKKTEQIKSTNAANLFKNDKNTNHWLKSSSNSFPSQPSLFVNPSSSLKMPVDNKNELNSKSIAPSQSITQIQNPNKLTQQQPKKIEDKPSSPPIPSLNQNKFDNSQLMNRIKKIESSNAKLEKDYVVMSIQLQSLKKKSQLDQKTINDMNKQITDLKKQLVDVNKLAKNCKCNAVRRDDGSESSDGYRVSRNKQNKPTSELKQIIKQLKSTNAKKELQSQKTNYMLQKQFHMIQNQTSKIQSLEKAFTNCLLYCRMSESMNQQQRTYHPSYNTNLNQNMMFPKRQQNPLSQSAVYNTSNNNFTSQFQTWRAQQAQQGWSEYFEDGYKIRYKEQLYVTGIMASQIEISNSYGKIIIFEGMNKSYLRSRPISQVVRIVQSSCEVIDPEWAKLRMRLVTFNFLNNRSMSPTDREQLRLKINEQANKTGLIFENLDDRTGDLYLISKPAFPGRSFND